MSLPESQRQDGRERRNETLHIQVLWGAEENSLPGLVLHASTHDISRSGFCAHANMALAEGRIFEVLLDLSGSAKPYLLTAEVRWCRSEAEQFLVGFALLEAQHSDIHAWQHRFDTGAAPY